MPLPTPRDAPVTTATLPSRRGIPSALEAVPQEEVVAVPAERAQRPGRSAVREEARALHEAELCLALGAAREERRHRQEELVDEAGGDERAEDGRPALAQDPFVPAR